MVNKKPQLRVKRRVPKKKTVVRRRFSPELPLARLINDPCGAPLVAPQYGASSGGYLTKLSRYVSVDMSVGGSGFIIWFPDYTGRQSAASTAANCFAFQSLTDSAPVNTTAEPLGTGTVGSADPEGYAVTDPAYNFVLSTTVQDSRTVASCMKMLYTGRNDALAGRVGVLTNISRDAILNGGGSAPATIAGLFNYATHVARTPMDEIEVKSRPTEGSEFYRNITNVEDRAFTSGNPGSTATTLGAGSPGGVGTGIGFCWSGFDTSSTIIFDFLKAIEWRPEFNSSLAAPSESVAASGGNLVSKATAWLDTHHPGWQHSLLNKGVSAMARIAETAFTGPANERARLAMSALPLLMG